MGKIWDATVSLWRPAEEDLTDKTVTLEDIDDFEVEEAIIEGAFDEEFGDFLRGDDDYEYQMHGYDTYDGYDTFHYSHDDIDLDDFDMLDLMERNR